MYFLSHGNSDKALDDLNEAIRLDPTGASRLRVRARVWYEKNDFERALADLTTACRLDPHDVESHQGRAWIMATCPDARFRNGKEGVVSATRACELTGWKVAHALTTLAAAYSEAGEFAQAADWQEKALALTSDKSAVEHEYRRLLARYQAKKPYRRMSMLEEARQAGITHGGEDALNTQPAAVLVALAGPN